jgi:hypothetical protein
MTPERFAHLAAAYGAQLQRWPAEERAAAQRLLASDDAHAKAALQQAQWLDGQLDGYRLAAPSPQLVQQIVASASPPPSLWGRWFGWLFPASFVGVGVAGVLAGMLVASLALPLPSSAHEALPNLFDSGDADLVQSLDTTEDTEQ